MKKESCLSGISFKPIWRFISSIHCSFSSLFIESWAFSMLIPPLLSCSIISGVAFSWIFWTLAMVSCETPAILASSLRVSMGSTRLAELCGTVFCFNTESWFSFALDANTCFKWKLAVKPYPWFNCCSPVIAKSWMTSPWYVSFCLGLPSNSASLSISE